jgi:hypothetical protein
MQSVVCLQPSSLVTHSPFFAAQRPYRRQVSVFSQSASLDGLQVKPALGYPGIVEAEQLPSDAQRGVGAQSESFPTAQNPFTAEQTPPDSQSAPCAQSSSLAAWHCPSTTEHAPNCMQLHDWRQSSSRAGAHHRFPTAHAPYDVQPVEA